MCGVGRQVTAAGCAPRGVQSDLLRDLRQKKKNKQMKFFNLSMSVMVRLLDIWSHFKQQQKMIFGCQMSHSNRVS